MSDRRPINRGKMKRKNWRGLAALALASLPLIGSLIGCSNRRIERKSHIDLGRYESVMDLEFMPQYSENRALAERLNDEIEEKSFEMSFEEIIEARKREGELREAALADYRNAWDYHPNVEHLRRENRKRISEELAEMELDAMFYNASDGTHYAFPGNAGIIVKKIIQGPEIVNYERGKTIQDVIVDLILYREYDNLRQVVSVGVNLSCGDHTFESLWNKARTAPKDDVDLVKRILGKI